MKLYHGELAAAIPVWTISIQTDKSVMLHTVSDIFPECRGCHAAFFLEGCGKLCRILIAYRIGDFRNGKLRAEQHLLRFLDAVGFEVRIYGRAVDVRKVFLQRCRRNAESFCKFRNSVVLLNIGDHKVMNGFDQRDALAVEVVFRLIGHCAFRIRQKQEQFQHF